jgi:hypothetical protein
MLWPIRTFVGLGITSTGLENYMTRKKMAIVAYAVGRVGSSAVMGLLARMGISVGPEAVRRLGGKHNPRGFYELKSQNDLLREVYRGVYSEPVSPPNAGWVLERAREGVGDFRTLIDASYPGDSPYCIKSPWCMTLPMWKLMEENYDCQYIYVTRNIEDQAKSLMKVWRSQPEKRGHVANLPFLTGWLGEWRIFCDSLLRQLSIEPLKIRYEELMSEKASTVSRIASHLDVDFTDDTGAEDWLTPNVYNET